MNYEIFVYDLKVIALKNATCKITFTEDRTRNVVSVICTNHNQVRDLIEKLQQFATPPPSYGVTHLEDLGGNR
mgnify:CR=1 FL=1